MKKKDWVGLKFDMLTVTKELANKMVAAVCDCGVEKEYPKARFSTRFRKSCGCHERIMKDGNVYNGILIEKDYVSMAPNGRRCIARCHCGNTFEYSTHDIIRGKVKSCGCVKNKMETGNKYGALLITQDAVNTHGPRMCVAKCNCGTEITVKTWNVVNGHTRSCGCVTKKSIDLNSRIFQFSNEESLYWAGFIAADGCICNRSLSIALKESDFGHLLKFKKWINGGQSITKDHKAKTVCFAVSHKMIGPDLIKYGVVPRKSLIYSPPPECVGSLDFWRGMIDGDGHIAKDGRGMIQLCGTKATCDAFGSFVRSFCGATSKSRAHHNIFIINFYGKYAIQIMQKLYGNNPKFYLDRKYALANKFCNFPLADDSGIN